MGKFSAGVLYQKEITEVDGIPQITGRHPFLTRTLARLVYLSTGKNVEETIAAIQRVVGNSPPSETFENMSAYQAAVADPDHDLTGVVCFIKEPAPDPTPSST